MLEDKRYGALADFFTEAEIELNNKTHLGVPLGALLSRYFIDTFRQIAVSETYSGTGIAAKIKNILRVIKFSLKALSNKDYINKVLDSTGKEQPKYIAARINTTLERSDSLFRDLLDRLGKNILYTRDASRMNAQLSIPVIQKDFIFLKVWQIPKLLKQTIAHANLVHKKLKKNKETTISFSEIMFFLYYFSLQLNTWDKFFEHYKPGYVLTDMDRYNAELILSARKHGIKTVTLVHGTIDKRYGYYPLIADYILCWGKDQQLYFLEKGISEDSMRIAGNPIAEKIAKFNRMDVLNTYHLSHEAEKPLIGVALSMQSIAFNTQMVKQTLVASGDNSFILVKLHPSDENIKAYEEEFKTCKNVTFSKNISLQEFISIANCCVTCNSGIAYETIACDVPVLFLNFDGSLIYSAFYPYFKKFFYEDETLLSVDIQNILSRKECYQNIVALQKKIIIDNYYPTIGQEAAEANFREIIRLFGT